MASKKTQGTDQLGSNFADPQRVAQEAAPATFQRKLEELFTGDVAQALNK
ncbi:MAG: hypothetical protein ABL903_17020 [Methylococcales bacterium]